MIVCTEQMLKEAALVDAVDSAVFRLLGRAGRLGYRGIRGVARGFGPLGRGVVSGARMVARGVERTADYAVRKPVRALFIGLPLAYSGSTVLGNVDRAVNNVSPENPYIV